VNPVLLSPAISKGIFFFSLSADNQDACTYETGRSVQITYLLSKHKDISYSRRQNHTRLRVKCDGTRAETRPRLSAKRTSPFKSVGVGGRSVQSTTGRRAVRISLQGLYCSCAPVFCGHVTLTSYPLHCLVSPSLLRPCITMCRHISNAVYHYSKKIKLEGNNK